MSVSVVPEHLRALTRARLTITRPDGSKERVGKLRFRWDGDHLYAGGRQQYAHEGDVVAAEPLQGANGWVVTMADGSTWVMAGCGCGG